MFWRYGAVKKRFFTAFFSTSGLNVLTELFHGQLISNKINHKVIFFFLHSLEHNTSHICSPLSLWSHCPLIQLPELCSISWNQLLPALSRWINALSFPIALPGLNHSQTRSRTTKSSCFFRNLYGTQTLICVKSLFNSYSEGFYLCMPFKAIILIYVDMRKIQSLIIHFLGCFIKSKTGCRQWGCISAETLWHHISQ